VSLNHTLSKNEKVEHHIRMKTHQFIVLRFWIKSGVNPICVGCAHVSLVLTLFDYPLSKDPLIYQHIIKHGTQRHTYIWTNEAMTFPIFFLYLYNFKYIFSKINIFNIFNILIKFYTSIFIYKEKFFFSHLFFNFIF